VNSFARAALVALMLACCGAVMAEDQSAEEALGDALTAAREGRREEALELVNQVIAAAPKSAQARYVRGLLYEALDRHAEAVADFGRAIELDPRAADAYDHRGSERLKLGEIDAAIGDFDRAIELDPPREAGHWKRGIAYYFAGRDAEGRKQFEGYQTVADNDVENAVWRFLCMARDDGPDVAKKELLNIKRDRRVPMMEVYELFAGRAMPDDVLAAARAGNPDAAELNQRMFYAEYYLGLHAEATGDKAAARQHVERAVQQYPLPRHYMWDMARVHADLLKADLLKADLLKNDLLKNDLLKNDK
jgi:lipoprotein NlpI